MAYTLADIEKEKSFKSLDPSDQDYVRRQIEKEQSKSAEGVERDVGVREPAPVAYQPERGLVGDVGSRLARGAAGLVSKAGHALRVADLDPTDSEGILDVAGEKLIGFAERAKEHEFLQPDIGEKDEGFLKSTFGAAIESAPASLSPLGTAAAGAAVGSLIPGVGTVVGGLIGGAAGLLGIFGAGTYGESRQQAEEHLRNTTDLTPEEIEERAHKYGMTHALFETGTEAVGDIAALLTFGGSKAVTQPLKATLKNLMGDSLKGSVQNFAKAYAKDLPFEAGSEVLAAYGQMSADEELGIGEGFTKEAAMEAAGTAAWMSLIFGSAVSGYDMASRRRTMNALESSRPEVREAAALDIRNQIARQTGDKQLADQWAVNAAQVIDRGASFNINQEISDFAAEKSEQDKDPAVKSLEKVFGAPREVPYYEQVIPERTEVQSGLTAEDVARQEEDSRFINTLNQKLRNDIPLEENEMEYLEAAALEKKRNVRARELAAEAGILEEEIETVETALPGAAKPPREIQTEAIIEERPPAAETPEITEQEVANFEEQSRLLNSVNQKLRNNQQDQLTPEEREFLDERLRRGAVARREQAAAEERRGQVAPDEKAQRLPEPEAETLGIAPGPARVEEVAQPRERRGLSVGEEAQEVQAPEISDKEFAAVEKELPGEIIAQATKEAEAIVNGDARYQEMTKVVEAGGIDLASARQIFADETIDSINIKQPGLISESTAGEKKPNVDAVASQLGYKSANDMVNNWEAAPGVKATTARIAREKAVEGKAPAATIAAPEAVPQPTEVVSEPGEEVVAPPTEAAPAREERIAAKPKYQIATRPNNRFIIKGDPAEIRTTLKEAGVKIAGTKATGGLTFSNKVQRQISEAIKQAKPAKEITGDLAILARDKGKMKKTKKEKAKPSVGSTNQQINRELQRFFTPLGYRKLKTGGNVIVVDKAADAKKTNVPIRSRDAAYVQGYFDPSSGKVTLIGENLRPEEVPGIIQHEFFHRSMALDPEFDGQALKNEFAGLRGKDNRVDAAYRKAIKAEGKDADQELINEEAIAYFLSDTANQKTTIYRKIMNAIREWLRNNFGDAFVKKMNPDEIRNLAIQSIKSFEERGEAPSAADLKDTATEVRRKVSGKYDIADLKENMPVRPLTKADIQSPEFRRWFGKSVVKRPMYHGSKTLGKTDLSSAWTFDPAMLAGKTGSPQAGLGHFFTGNRSEAAGYATAEGTIHKVALRIENPFEVNSWELPQTPTKAEARAFAKRKELQGHDGIYLKDEDHYIVFDSNQVKSLQQGTGEFSMDNPDIRYSMAQKVQDTVNKIRQPISENETFRQFMHNVVDKNLAIKDVQKQLGDVDESLDVFMTETQRPKVTAYLNEKFWDEKVRPLIADMASSDITVGDVENLAHAMHAEEANEALRRANAKLQLNNILATLPDGKLRNDLEQKMKDAENKPDAFLPLLEDFLSNNSNAVPGIARYWNDVKDALSGMTTAEANDIKNKWKGNKDIHEFVARVSEINSDRLDILHDSGQISDEEYGAYKAKYKNYVPLYREGFEGEVVSGVGRGLSAAGKPIKTRAGSTRGVVDILSNTIKNYETAIVRAEKAKSSRQLLELVKNNPDPDLWSIEKDKKDKNYDKAGNLKEYSSRNFGPNEMELKVDGERYILTVNRDNKPMMRMLETIKGEGVQSGPIVNALSKVNRYLSAINTMYAPEFILSNFARDIQTATINIKDTDLSAKKMLGNVKNSMATIAKVETGKGKPDKEDADLYERYKKSGGKIGWADVHQTAADLSKTIKREYDIASGKRPVLSTVKKWNSLWEGINSSVENAARFSAFKVGVEAGMTDKAAAQMASDLTVDFTKKGAKSQVLNSLYLFFNASVQGNYRIMRALTNKNVQKMAAGIVGIGFAAGAWNALVGGDDEFEDFQTERNLMLKIPNSDKSIKIPLPWGFNVIYGIGTELSRMAFDDKYKPSEGAARLATHFANAFNPMASGTLLQTLSPTMLDPIAMVSENKNWFGGELMPGKNPFDKVPTPDSQRYWKSASTPSKFIASSLNRLTGGDKVTPGAIDVSPETLDLISDQLGGSALRFVKDSALLPDRFSKGDVQVKDIPFARRVVAQKPEWASAKKYYQARQDILTVARQREIYPGVELENKKLLRLRGILNNTEKQIRKLRKTYQRTGNEKILARIKKLQDRLTRRYDKLT